MKNKSEGTQLSLFVGGETPVEELPKEEEIDNKVYEVPEEVEELPGQLNLFGEQMDYAATIKYRSRNEVSEKPRVFTTGGYSALKSDGEEICFDWNDMRANCSHTEDGHIELEVTLTSFDSDIFGDGNPMEYISAKELTSLELTEVFYNCTEDDEEMNFIFLDIVEFNIYDRIADKPYSFSEDNLDNINNLNFEEYTG